MICLIVKKIPKAVLLRMLGRRALQCHPVRVPKQAAIASALEACGERAEVMDVRIHLHDGVHILTATPVGQTAKRDTLRFAMTPA